MKISHKLAYERKDQIIINHLMKITHKLAYEMRKDYIIANYLMEITHKVAYKRKFTSDISCGSNRLIFRTIYIV